MAQTCMNGFSVLSNFFDYYDTPDSDRLTISSVHLDKDVVPWYQMVQRLRPFTSWVEFTRALELDFGPSVYDCPRATLFKLSQTGTVAEYYLQFTSLANRVYGLSNDAMVDCFVSGLNNQIRRDVLIHTPPSLVKAVSLAKVYEEKYADAMNTQKATINNHSTNKPFINKPEIATRNTAPILNTPPTRPMSQFQKNPNIKRMSPAERQVRRDKGLCYWCDEKFSFTHKCPNRQMLLLQYDDDDNDADQVFDTLTQTEQVTTNGQTTNLPEHHLSLNALKGTSNMGVIRFAGSIEHIGVQILIDGGSSDNFMQPRIAKFLKLPIEPGPQFNVLVGNGEVMSAEGMIQKLPLHIQGHVIEVPVYLLPIAGADVILGASWLATLGPHVADYASLTLKFFLKGQFVTLTGEPMCRPSQAQLHHFKRLATTDSIAECFTVQCIKPTVEEDIFKDLPDNIEPEIAMLLHQYRGLFQTPTTLPPNRSHNHSIPLLEGSAPVKVKPYRYPHSQKQQIELMIQEMLQQGIIQNSNSPFSSPIILVKKKDGTWRVMVMAWSEPKWQLLDQVRRALENDNQLREVMQNYAIGKAPVQYSMREGLLYWKQRLVIPKNDDLLQKLLFEFHTSPIGGHAGITRTIARIKAQFYWPDMKKDIAEYVHKCVVCQQAKTTNTSPAGLLQPLPIPSQVWEDIAMDFITGLPLSYGYTTIMVVVDRLTKSAHFIPMKTDYTSKTVAEAFMHNIVKLHGMPKSIVSDRDKVFTSAFWQHLFKMQGTSLAMSSAYHPQTDGQTEVLNKTLELFLRCFTFHNPKSWFKVMSWAEYWYNTAFQTSIGMTPFKALYGRDPPYLTKYEVQVDDPPALREELMERDQILQQLKTNLERAQQYMKQQADKHRREVSFKVGDLVLVKLQPYKQQSVALRKNQKLGMRYFGPFEVIACVGKVAYKLQLPENAKIHPVFHVSQLKPFHGTSQEQYLPLPLTMSDTDPIFQPATILQARTIVRGNKKVHQLQIQWDLNSPEEASWEDLDELQNNESAKLTEGPPNMHENETVRGPRRSQRAKKEHKMWKEYAK
ncbi:unnamed protein product [Trifolium pratense]|uniref:Uncharacterized protein n=1 Tax=Trifolium pratense TaxID=57577 RepID=A0ACB0KJ76_TRIPR|nr:unnamed protein product [Trifolium pratense]